MSEYAAELSWRRGDDAFTDCRYSRVHDWSFDGGTHIRASSSPQHVPTPMSDAAAVDPEEAFVAAVASCHLLSFLILAAKRGLVVASYSDHATGTMAKQSDGRDAIIRITLAPHVVFSGDKTPTAAEYAALHHAAHEACYIANSIRSEIVTAATFAVLTPAAG